MHKGTIKKINMQEKYRKSITKIYFLVKEREFKG